MEITRPQLPTHLETFAQPSWSVDPTYVVKAPDEKRISSTYWTCAVCFNVPRYPVMLKQCGHVGCAGCMHRLYSRRFAVVDSQKRLPDSTCPYCRRSFLMADIIPYSRWEVLSKGAFDSVEVSCSNSDEAVETEDEGMVAAEDTCDFVGSMEELKGHQLKSCKNRIVKCPNSGCTFPASKFSAVAEHFKECDKLVTYCHKCNLPTPWTTRGVHDCVASLRGTLFGKNRNRWLCRTAMYDNYYVYVCSEMVRLMQKHKIEVNFKCVPGEGGTVYMAEQPNVASDTESVVYESGSHISEHQQQRSTTPPPPPPPPGPGATPVADLRAMYNGSFGRAVEPRRRILRATRGPPVSPSDGLFVDVIATIPPALQ